MADRWPAEALRCALSGGVDACLARAEFPEVPFPPSNDLNEENEGIPTAKTESPRHRAPTKSLPTSTDGTGRPWSPAAAPLLEWTAANVPEFLAAREALHRLVQGRSAVPGEASTSSVDGAASGWPEGLLGRGDSSLLPVGREGGKRPGVNLLETLFATE
jgi:hypothetical protein